MKIVAISDTHGNFPLALRVVEQAAPFDAVIHLGDGEDDTELLGQVLDCRIIRIAGNCDHASPAPREMVWECEGKRLFLTHGDRYGVKCGIGRLAERGSEIGADAVLFGHTHFAVVTTHAGILCVNPGTLKKSSEYNSFAVLDITPSGITAHLQTIS